MGTLPGFIVTQGMGGGNPIWQGFGGQVLFEITEIIDLYPIIASRLLLEADVQSDIPLSHTINSSLEFGYTDPNKILRFYINSACVSNAEISEELLINLKFDSSIKILYTINEEIPFEYVIKAKPETYWEIEGEIDFKFNIASSIGFQYNFNNPIIGG